MASDQQDTLPVVLIVEDEPLLLLLAIGIAEDAGFETVVAANADDAVEILIRRPDIRIIFADIVMPGSMDGLKLAALVRDRWPPIEIILISGQHTPSQKDMPTGSRFFAKPYDATRIGDAMRQMAA